MYEFILPDIGEGISEALLINWSVEVGQQVAEGDEIATVSTDKVDVELPSPKEGVVAELCWKPGDTVKVGSVFMRIDTGESEDSENTALANTDQGSEETAAAKRPALSRPSVSPRDGGIVAAPSTRKLASDLGIDLGSVVGTGIDGRILRKDVENMQLQNSDNVNGQYEPLDSVRAVMAERMANSVHTLAHSTINFEMRADRFVQVLQDAKVIGEQHNVPISATTILIQSLVGPLSRHPRFNATIAENVKSLLLHSDVNLGIAMATERGLMVPVLRSLNDKSLINTAEQFQDLLKRARSGALDLNEMSNGTFTMSNTGGLEKAAITSTRPVINAPQTAILWISKIQQRPVIENGEVEIGMVMNASISFDHRYIDGADAVAFINDLAGTIEAPEELLKLG